MQKLPIKRLCKWCQKELIDKRSDALFCNKICKKRHWDRQKYPIPAKRLTPIQRKEMRYQSKLNWQANNRERHLQIRKNWSKQRYNTNPTYRLSVNLRNRLYEALKNNIKTGSAVKDLGCSIEELKKHLEDKFYFNSETREIMSWDNYGSWHIDHIRPLASFNLSDPEELKKACHYSNLQPLWAKDNLEKKDKREN